MAVLRNQLQIACQHQVCMIQISEISAGLALDLVLLLQLLLILILVYLQYLKLCYNVTMLPKRDAKTRAKYAVIRLKNILHRFPPAVFGSDPALKMMYSVADQLWNSVQELTPTDSDIADLESAADQLEKTLELLDDK